MIKNVQSWCNIPGIDSQTEITDICFGDQFIDLKLKEKWIKSYMEALTVKAQFLKK